MKERYIMVEERAEVLLIQKALKTTATLVCNIKRQNKIKNICKEYSLATPHMLTINEFITKDYNIQGIKKFYILELNNFLKTFSLRSCEVFEQE